MHCAHRSFELLNAFHPRGVVVFTEFVFFRLLTQFLLFSFFTLGKLSIVSLSSRGLHFTDYISIFVIC